MIFPNIKTVDYSVTSKICFKTNNHEKCVSGVGNIIEAFLNGFMCVDAACWGWSEDKICVQKKKDKNNHNAHFNLRLMHIVLVSRSSVF